MGPRARRSRRGPRERDTLADGIPAARGRLFAADEEDAAKPAVAVITDTVWKTRFGGNPEVVGQAVRMDEDEVTIVGVLPPGIRPFDVDVWFPHRPSLMSAMQLDRANHPGFGVVARLRPGVDAGSAQREMSNIASALEREYPASNRDMGVMVEPMLDAVAGGIKPTLRLLMAAVGVLLLIACANVANLLLARGSAASGRRRSARRSAQAGAARAAVPIEGLGARDGRRSRDSCSRGVSVSCAASFPTRAAPIDRRRDRSSRTRFCGRPCGGDRRAVCAGAGRAAFAGRSDARAATGRHRGRVRREEHAPPIRAGLRRGRASGRAACRRRADAAQPRQPGLGRRGLRRRRILSVPLSIAAGFAATTPSSGSAIVCLQR